MGSYVCTCDVRCEEHPGDPSADERQDRIDAALSYIRQALATVIDNPIPADRVHGMLLTTLQLLRDGEAGDE